MTEKEWLALDNFCVLVDRTFTAFGLPSNRRARLLCAALCRHVWSLITEDACRTAVEIAERFADASAIQSDLEDAYQNASQAITAANKAALQAAESDLNASIICDVAVCALDAVVIFEEKSSFDVETASHIHLFRDIFGNPFRPVRLDPRWQSSTVLDLARTIYDDRKWERMPILADALMDAGCDSEEIIEHCQGPGPHVRGCWVVDLLLAKA